MKLIVGLGNPEEKYIGTRHNLGFDVLDHYINHLLPVKESEKFWSINKNLKAEMGQKDGVWFAKPTTFMNDSGMAVKAIADYYKISPKEIVIVYDELDLPLGQIKIRLGGAAAGHHGVESIIESLGTDKFVRVRLGIGTAKSESGEHGGNTFVAEKFVLGQFTQRERSQLKHLTKRAIEALKTLLEDGLEKAQHQFN